MCLEKSALWAWSAAASCGEEEVVTQIHTLFVRSAQQVAVYALQVQEEREGVRQEVRDVEGESKAKRNAHMNMDMWMV